MPVAWPAGIVSPRVADTSGPSAKVGSRRWVIDRMVQPNREQIASFEFHMYEGSDSAEVISFSNCSGDSPTPCAFASARP